MTQASMTSHSWTRRWIFGSVQPEPFRRHFVRWLIIVFTVKIGLLGIRFGWHCFQNGCAQFDGWSDGNYLEHALIFGIVALLASAFWALPYALGSEDEEVKKIQARREESPRP